VLGNEDEEDGVDGSFIVLSNDDEDDVGTYPFILRQRLVVSCRTVPFGHFFKQFPIPGGNCSLSGGQSFLTLHLCVFG
jgi:hypothetical protein